MAEDVDSEREGQQSQPEDRDKSGSPPAVKELTDVGREGARHVPLTVKAGQTASVSHPEGIAAISRGLRSAATTPPGN